MQAEVFKSQRRRILEQYAKAGQEIIAHTIPYHSTGVLEFDIVDHNDDPSPGVAFAVARKNQAITFFSYGVGDQVFLGGSGNTRATEAETNMARATSTNGAQDYVIEGVGFACRGARIDWSDALDPVDPQPTDADVLSAMKGDVAVYDPAAIFSPPQMQSPFLLENGMFQALLGLSSLEFTFDRKRVEKIGTVDLLPQAGAQSYLRSNGAPESSNRYSIPEGYLWRRDGQPDCELEATVTLQRALVVPINQVLTWGTVNNEAAPTKIWLEVVMRLYGLGIDLPSAN